MSFSERSWRGTPGIIRVVNTTKHSIFRLPTEMHLENSGKDRCTQVRLRPGKHSLTRVFSHKRFHVTSCLLLVRTDFWKRAFFREMVLRDFCKTSGEVVKINSQKEIALEGTFSQALLKEVFLDKAFVQGIYRNEFFCFEKDYPDTFFWKSFLTEVFKVFTERALWQYIAWSCHYDNTQR